ncbi:MAG: hypothetical protein H6698_04960 [Myxococcales bacterium]|nr:hypothetical protein [Myxococcales bacterium]MCB9533651.1 hypothetical protein [Myxococcales bacterium]
MTDDTKSEELDDTNETDDEEGDTETDADESPSAEGADSDEDAEPAESEPAAAPAKAEPAKGDKKADAKKGDDKKGKGKKADAKKARDEEPAKPHSIDGHPHDLPPMTNSEAIETLFTGTGSESVPTEPSRSSADDDIEDVTMPASSPKVLAISLVAVLVVLGIGFAMLPANLKQDAVALLKGQDIIELRRNREEARVAEERRQMLANAPKFGTVQIVADPSNMLVTSPGQPAMIFPGSRNDMTYPSRTRVTYQDISVTEDFVFTIDGEGNLQNKTFTIPAFGATDSPWVQSFSGDYAASLTFVVCWPGQPAPVEEKFCLYPVPERAAELQWRRDWRPDPNETDPEAIIRLPGSITVTSDPPGALIAFNGQQLVDEETGEPHRTPYTFNTYNAPRDREDRTPLEVYLSREGLPLQLLYDGKASTRFGVYAHQFTCTLKDGAQPPAPLAPDAPADAPAPTWLGLCDYSYSVHVALVDPKPPEAEGSGEGSGAAAAPAGSGAHE